MRRVLSTVDRWGPGLIAILTLFAVVSLGWQYDKRIAKSQGDIEGLQKQINLLQQQINNRVTLESSLRSEVQTWQAHVVVLRIKMTEAGMKDIPLPPQSSKQ